MSEEPMPLAERLNNLSGAVEECGHLNAARWMREGADCICDLEDEVERLTRERLLIRAEEREKCAKVLDVKADELRKSAADYRSRNNPQGGIWADTRAVEATNAAAAIRARKDDE